MIPSPVCNPCAASDDAGADCGSNACLAIGTNFGNCFVPCDGGNSCQAGESCIEASAVLSNATGYYCTPLHVSGTVLFSTDNLCQGDENYCQVFNYTDAQFADAGLSDVVTQLQRVQACQFNACVGGPVDMRIAAFNTPTSVLSRVQAAIGVGLAGFDLGAIATCLNALAAQDCNDFLTQVVIPACDEALYGLGVEGTYCEDDTVCEEGYWCEFMNGDCTGHCAAHLPFGEACVIDRQCTAGAFCLGGFCQPLPGPPAPDLNASCASPGNYKIQCSPQLSCQSFLCEPINREHDACSLISGGCEAWTTCVGDGGEDFCTRVTNTTPGDPVVNGHEYACPPGTHYSGGATPSCGPTLGSDFSTCYADWQCTSGICSTIGLDGGVCLNTCPAVAADGGTPQCVVPTPVFGSSNTGLSCTGGLTDGTVVLPDGGPQGSCTGKSEVCANLNGDPGGAGNCVELCGQSAGFFPVTCPNVTTCTVLGTGQTTEVDLCLPTCSIPLGFACANGLVCSPNGPGVNDPGICFPPCTTPLDCGGDGACNNGVCGCASDAICFPAKCDLVSGTCYQPCDPSSDSCGDTGCCASTPDGGLSYCDGYGSLNP